MKKKISLAVAIILTLSFITSGAYATTGDSSENPILISTPEELDNMRNGLNKHYKLSNDIDLTDYLTNGGAGYSKWGASGWLPIGTNLPATARFTGGLDGGGHKITGLQINRSDTGFVGLFGFIDSADIRNLGVEIFASSEIRGRNIVGGLVGSQLSVDNTISNSYRCINTTLNGSIIPVIDSDSASNKRHGGVVAADALMTKSTYTVNSWLFDDSSPTPGPWYWDTRGFPKLNIGAENFPFSF